MTPSSLDIIAAVQDSRFIKDPFFIGTNVSLMANGRPEAYGGGFSQVFTIVKDGEKWGFKIWSREIIDNEARYEKIVEHLGKYNLPYFVDFEFVPKGILVDGELLDTMRIRWVHGQPLVSYVSRHLHDPNVLMDLAGNFLRMTKDLHDASISHGDLHHDNIFVGENGDIKLIDYDSICVPALEGERDISRGRPGYQHPSRLSSGYLSSIKMDYFSELVIYLSLIAVAENPILWDKYSVAIADTRLLFTPENFLDFEAAEIRRDLNFLSDNVRGLVTQLDSYLAAHLKLEPVRV